MIEIEVQNETNQTQERLRFAVVPRLGEGIRLLDPSGFWASYDVIDVWYQKAEYGEIWVPYIHIRLTGSDPAAASDTVSVVSQPVSVLSQPVSVLSQKEPLPSTI